MNSGRVPHEELREKAKLLIGEMHKAVEGVETADLEKARQAIKRALEKGTSVAFKRIKNEGAQQRVEAGGLVKSYALHDQLQGQQAAWSKLWKHDGEVGKAWAYDPSVAKIFSQSVSRLFGGLPEDSKQALLQFEGGTPGSWDTPATSSRKSWPG